ncbi:hypothetical protein FN846DRAFT_547839 [Sphaerosporella brunnea]|uniref:Uncharacterized protein n=1 Tax=Sphaerosporella brunnea TaxID=1250544 RepID=A0A5J5F300_9PEZI|nr:hypothetical protein FN846DRAFT_547839 [Sphaerosporella brunnea]
MMRAHLNAPVCRRLHPRLPSASLGFPRLPSPLSGPQRGSGHLRNALGAAGLRVQRRRRCGIGYSTALRLRPCGGLRVLARPLRGGRCFVKLEMDAHTVEMIRHVEKSLRCVEKSLSLQPRGKVTQPHRLATESPGWYAQQPQSTKPNTTAAATSARGAAANRVAGYDTWSRVFVTGNFPGGDTTARLAPPHDMHALCSQNGRYISTDCDAFAQAIPQASQPPPGVASNGQWPSPQIVASAAKSTSRAGIRHQKTCTRRWHRFPSGDGHFRCARTSRCE